jgi:serine/threonine-protein kinase HipA
MLADALPDDFGNALIDAWMATKGIEKSGITILDRLAYMGKRGMGALEFRPARGSHTESSAPIEMKQLVEEARRLVQGSFAVDHEAKAALANIIKVGTSAGGARAKAVIAWNPKTDEVRSGQFDIAPGFEHWLLKFDGWVRARVTDASNTPTPSWRMKRASSCLLAGYWKNTAALTS